MPEWRKAVVAYARYGGCLCLRLSSLPYSKCGWTRRCCNAIKESEARKGFLQDAGGCPFANDLPNAEGLLPLGVLTLRGGGSLSEISIFADESGGQGGRSKYYALTLVFHDQSDGIMGEVEKYRRGLATRGLEEIPLHAGPLLTGHDSYGAWTSKTGRAI